MGEVLTDDGVRMAYYERGSGQPLVLLTGWAQTAAMFEAQLDELGRDFRVVAPDFRSHGESETVAHGARITRFACDVESFLESLDLHDVHLLGWSMGVTVALAYYDLFGPARLASVVLVDQPPVFVRRPTMSAKDAASVGAFLEFADVVENDRALRADPQGWVSAFEAQFLTTRQDRLGWLIAQALQTPAHFAADLLMDLVLGDWRDVVPRIALPALVVGAGRSHIPVASQEWLARSIPDASLKVFRDHAHMPFFEAPGEFNAVVRDFLDGV
jgi:pimeloyl-ACP methyl ester carboxylesterase